MGELPAQHSERRYTEQARERGAAERAPDRTNFLGAHGPSLHHARVRKINPDKREPLAQIRAEIPLARELGKIRVAGSEHPNRTRLVEETQQTGLYTHGEGIDACQVEGSVCGFADGTAWFSLRAGGQQPPVPRLAE